MPCDVPNFKEQDFVKLGAVCQMAKPTCAANIRQLAENLDQFDFAPNAHTPEELGRYMIQRSGTTNMTRTLKISITMVITVSSEYFRKTVYLWIAAMFPTTAH